ncbi:MAG: glutamate--tRNA ligase [Bdellovibrionales bacterium]|nr:glutamate--tRNA ligase [Bdellovibrionales bacterium]
MSVRVRFAPSPTGSLHIGGARTALFNYLFAKKYKGNFILRVEDTDQERHEESSVKTLIHSLEWLGLSWDEGLFIQGRDLKSKGDYGPYRQRERLSIYLAQAQKLLQQERAYYCFLTDEEVSQKRKKAMEEGRPFRLLSPYRHLSLEEAEKKRATGEQACIRFKVPEDQTFYRVRDLVRGEVEFPADAAGDFILIRSDGFPVYNFSCAVDDALMKITHIFRGEEHLSNTARQFMIQEALGFTHPVTGHLSLLMGPDKRKLSKRENAESVEYLEEEGFLPEALMNFLAFLGWNPGTEQEYFKQRQLIEAFSTEGLNASSAVFDKDKLLWLNGEHIKNTDNKQLWKTLHPFFERENLVFNSDPLWQDRVLTEMKSGFKTLRQAVEVLKPLSKEGFVLEESAKPVLEWPVAKPFIQRWIKALEKHSEDYLSLEDFKSIQKQIQENLKGKEFFMPLRCAILGKPQGTEIKVLVTLLKRVELIRRAEESLKYIV